MRTLVEHAWFAVSLALGTMLRSARYATTRLVQQGSEREVRKRRLVHAPVLVWLGSPLVALLDTGVRVLPQREWEERERHVWRLLRGITIRIEAGGTLVLPHLDGRTLASLLEDREMGDQVRERAVEHAVVALAAFHRMGLAHGDAMAENVIVDMETGTAHWFDFETIHDASRPATWRRADDLRTLLATCVMRSAPERRAGTVRLILDAYGDAEVSRVLARSFTSVLRRSLPFHLGQAPSSLRDLRELHRLIRERDLG